MRRMVLTAAVVIAALVAAWAASSSAAPSNRVRRIPRIGAYVYDGKVSVLDDATRQAMTPSVWRPGCPVGLDDLRAVDVAFHGLDGTAHRGRLVVHRDVAAGVSGVFKRLWDEGFQLSKVVPIEAYGGDDERSMADDNTSAFNCRYVAGTTSYSEHAYGKAVDVNTVENPYVSGSTVDPPAGRAYLDRSNVRPGMAVPGSSLNRAFADLGWGWGGDFRSIKDYQHFSQSGR